MKLKLPPYVHAFTDRHGTPRYYYRRHGKRKPLPGLPWSPDFMAAHASAAEAKTADKKQIGSAKTLPGSINFLVTAYFNSSEFHQLAKTTRATYRGILEGFRLEHGNRSAEGLNTRAVAAIVSRKAATPAAAGNRRRRGSCGTPAPPASRAPATRRRSASPPSGSRGRPGRRR